jgi:hypothetical protein
MSISQCLVRRTVESGFTLDRNRSESGRSFWCEQVHELLSIRWIGFRGDDAMSFQLALPIGLYVRGDALIRFHRLLIRSDSAEHPVADDQQRPVIAQHLHGGIQCTPQQPLSSRPLAWHISTVVYFHLRCASKMSHTDFRRGGSSCKVRLSETFAPVTRLDGKNPG